MSQIYIKNLVKKYGKILALNKFNLSYDYIGSVIVFIGPNGAGKTTLLRILSGQLKPSSGIVELLGFNVVEEVSKVHEVVSFLPQDIRPPMYNLTVMDYIVTYLMMRGYDRSYAKNISKAILSRMELDKYINTKVSKLSGGTIKKIFLAMVLSPEDVDIYFLDEPLSGLDPRSRVILWELIRERTRDNKLVVVASHFLEDMPVLADYIVVVDNGVNILEGRPKELINRLLGNYSKKIIIRNYELNSLSSVISQEDRVIPIGDTLIIYSTDYESLLNKLPQDGCVVELMPIGLSDIVLAMGVIKNEKKK